MPLVPRDGDHDENAASLANVSELVFALLDAVAPEHVVEVGAFHGKGTRDLLDWVRERGARATAIDPEPESELVALAEREDALELLIETSHEALPRLGDADAVILDGDHNYFTLSRELAIIAERAPGAELPLLVLHDVGWPLARRDAYYAPDRIPEEHRQPLARDVYLAPGEEGLVDGGLPFACVAVREGGPENGIMTALEDFISQSGEDLRLAVIPAFFGVGVVWHPQAPWAEAVAKILEPWDRNPIVARLEANRIVHLVERWRLAYGIADAMPRWRLQEQQEALLRTMLDSSAFTWAERASRLRQGGRPAFSREQLREALGERG
jgi:hypothetical protein